MVTDIDQPDTSGISPRQVDFFVSYTGADARWAEWIAWTLEDAGHSTRIQSWDFTPGAHFVTEMHQATERAARTVAVLSDSYLASAFAAAEWQAVWASDPTGRDRRLLACRVENCRRPGLLAQLVTIDLFDVDAGTAQARLLAAAAGRRGKPPRRPAFPGVPAQLRPAQPRFPGRPIPGPRPADHAPTRSRHALPRHSGRARGGLVLLAAAVVIVLPTTLGITLAVDRAGRQHPAVATSPTTSPRTVPAGTPSAMVRTSWGATFSPRATRLIGASARVQAVAFSPVGAALVAGSDDDTVQRWDTTIPAEPRRLDPLTGGLGSMLTVAFSADGRILATGDDANLLRLWNVADPGKPKVGVPLLGPPGTPDQPRFVQAVAFSPTSYLLAAGLADGRMRLWDVADPLAPLWLSPELRADSDAVRAMAFSPDGRTLATAGNDRTIQLWDVTNPAAPVPRGRPLAGHTGKLRTVAFSPDGSVLASGGDDNTIRLWNVTKPNAPTPRGDPLIGHVGPVSAVAFTADGGTLVSGGEDGTVRLWAVAAPAAPTPADQGRILINSAGRVLALAVSADGGELAAGGDDTTVRLWRIG
ncbi:toll/interleukin-1 receptor domain-containing protein [Frankia gtarii]|uniref:toll/interleukin-1 receptor domain-containing protein n=1 Tax=Frankia gtarii TaxID=2950102 RepID=UPI0021BDF2E6|nr:TIR domain-containing protein [Frankia gtarii]